MFKYVPKIYRNKIRIRYDYIYNLDAYKVATFYFYLSLKFLHIKRNTISINVKV